MVIYWFLAGKSHDEPLGRFAEEIWGDFWWLWRCSCVEVLKSYHDDDDDDDDHDHDHDHDHDDDDDDHHHHHHHHQPSWPFKDDHLLAIGSQADPSATPARSGRTSFGGGGRFAVSDERLRPRRGVSDKEKLRRFIPSGDNGRSRKIWRFLLGKCPFWGMERS